MEEIATLFDEMKERVASIILRNRNIHRCDFNCDHCMTQALSAKPGNSSPDSGCDATDCATAEEMTVRNTKVDGHASSVGVNESMDLEASNSTDENSRTRRSSTRTAVLYKCHHCSQSFKSITDLNSHSVRHYQSRPFKCVGCEKAFMQKKHLKEHEFKACRATTFKCIECAKTFRDRQKCKSHMEIHATNKAAEVESKRKDVKREKSVCLCPVCKQRFSTDEGLSVHLMKHSGLNPFKCNRCDKKFTKLSSLRMHTVRAHSS